MTTKTKRTPLPALRPPMEIRDNTKARRAWLAEQLASLPKGIEGRITQQGSYQQLSRWTVTEVTARLRHRGTCQICGGSQVHDGGIALHGYRRPKWGYVIGRCEGTHLLPAELDITHTTRQIEQLERTISELRSEMEAMRSLSGKEPQYGTEGFKKFHQLRSDLRGRQMYLDHLQGFVLPRFGQPLVVELVA